MSDLAIAMAEAKLAIQGEKPMDLTAQVAALTAENERLKTERDTYLEELGKVIMACPMRPGMRMHPPSQGVRNLRTAFEALEALATPRTSITGAA